MGLALIALACLVAPPTVGKAVPLPEWNAAFAGGEGWIGGDGAYSVPLGKDRVLWLFGDTLIGKVMDGGRAGSTMINNTAAVQTGRGADAKFAFTWKRTKDGKPASLIATADGKGWFWPQAAILDGEKLFLFLPRLAKAEGPEAFGFKHVGQTLGIVENPSDAPEKWTVVQHEIPHVTFAKNDERSFGSAVLADGEYVYGYAETGTALDRKKLVAARVPAGKLADFAAWRFRTADGWSEKPTEVVPLASGIASEFSVSRLATGSYVLVTTENGIGDRIVARFADSPVGPWSEATLLYRCPEGADKRVFCYSAKAHPWAATGNELVVSYCSNTWEFATLFKDASTYRPKFVRIPLAK